MNKWQKMTVQTYEITFYIKPFNMEVMAFTVQTLKHFCSCFYSPVTIPEKVSRRGSARA